MSKKPQHTPGPWEAFRAGNFDFFDVLAADGRPVCQVHRNRARKVETSSNADLIQAAPDLLDVAQLVLDLANNNKTFALPPSVRTRLVAAIEKAIPGAHMDDKMNSGGL